MEVAIVTFALLLNVIYCHDSESSETNRGDTEPSFYDALIYNDIAGIINEVANNPGSPFDVFLSDSGSGENIEDLLSEYQHFLEKAHKQRKAYIASQNTKKKNKVPPIRHEQFTKTKKDTKYDNVYINNRLPNLSIIKIPQEPIEYSIDTFMPLNVKGKNNKPDIAIASVPIGNNELLHPIEKLLFGEKAFHLQPMFHSIKSCYCKKMPCDCNCKDCIIDTENTEMLNNIFDDEKRTVWSDSLYDSSLKKSEAESVKDSSDNTFNIRIRVDIQIPKELGKGKFQPKDKINESEKILRENATRAINLPFPFSNLPIPIDILGFQKVSKYNKEDLSPMHKLTIHKKKKSRANNTTKKHRKKIITIHKFQLETQATTMPHIVEKNDSYVPHNKSTFANDTNQKATTLLGNNTLNKIEEVLNETLPNNVLSVVNISSNTLNISEDLHKNENSIESDYSKIPDVVNTTILPSLARNKRNIRNNIIVIKNNAKNDTMPNIKTVKDKNTSKKSDKNGQSDNELLYWPNVTRPQGSYLYSKNITTFILENELKKAKLNISKETIRRNHTKALEQVIFGDVDWDNMNQVAPAFMAFVGKYICGALTFCSQKVCHSMNCAQKTCTHRVCLPEHRLNNKGHCAGSASKDSVATMESITDLPTNVAFEIVDILQNKMLGKLFGKATFCINSKCITFSAAKKNFTKFRCTIKEINSAGHCINAKNVKIM